LYPGEGNVRLGRNKAIPGRRRASARSDQRLVRHPPLLPNEDPNRYRQLFAAFAHAIRPTDVLECVWLKDDADLQWEILRYRRWKAALIEGTERDAIRSLLQSALNDGMQAEEELNSQAARVAHDWDIVKDLRERFSADPRATGIIPEIINAQAFGLRSKPLAIVEKMLADADRRRNMVLREIERHRDVMAKRLREVSEKLIEADGKTVNPEDCPIQMQ
jgi:hypothetical protein